MEALFYKKHSCGDSRRLSVEANASDFVLLIDELVSN
jgi:hypothetical protein